MEERYINGKSYFRCLIIAAALTLPITSIAEHSETRVLHVKGVPVTGFNEVCGEAVQEIPLPPPLSPTFHGAFVGEYDPSAQATDAIPLTPTNCNSEILLATTTDPTYRDTFGFPDPDSRLKNVQLRNVATTITFDGLRSSLPSMGILPPNPFPPTKNQSNEPITLGDWLNAKGHMKIRCNRDGSARVKIWLRKLVPDSIYSVLAIWNTTPPGFSAPTVVPLPLGGLPNIVVTNSDGNAKFDRKLVACPMDPTPDGSSLLFVDVGYHSDNNVSGAVPVPLLESKTFITQDGDKFSSVLGSGTAAHDHLDFFLTGNRIIE